MNQAKPIRSCAAVRALDQRAIHEAGIPGMVLMEVAGRRIVDLLLSVTKPRSVVILCGGGNNGGDGFVIARHLDAMGVLVEVILQADPNNLTGDCAITYAWLTHTHVVVRESRPTTNAPRNITLPETHPDVVVDALLGTGAKGPPRPPMAQLIRWANDLDCKRIAVDVPSGLDATTGLPAEPTFRADWTGTFVAAKPGLVVDTAQRFVGQLAVLDIGIPRKILDAGEPRAH